MSTTTAAAPMTTTTATAPMTGPGIRCTRKCHCGSSERDDSRNRNGHFSQRPRHYVPPNNYRPFFNELAAETFQLATLSTTAEADAQKRVVYAG
jgi:hypothetical protein